VFYPSFRRVLRFATKRMLSFLNIFVPMPLFLHLNTRTMHMYYISLCIVHKQQHFYDFLKTLYPGGMWTRVPQADAMSAAPRRHVHACVYMHACNFPKIPSVKDLTNSEKSLNLGPMFRFFKLFSPKNLAKILAFLLNLLLVFAKKWS
jgi:hypothetical protein